MCIFKEIDNSYPPHGLPESIKKLPEWIQLGCGDAEYVSQRLS